jgi:ABC-type transporter Mla subunit MlaD
MTSSLDLISTERDLLNSYTDTFSQKQTDVQAKYQAVVDRMASSIASENEETAALAQLQKQLDELSLNATLDKFKEMQTDLDAKYKAYTDLVQSNNTLAATIFQNSTETKELVTEIISVISALDANIAQINTTIDTYSTVSATPAPVTAEASAP